MSEIRAKFRHFFSDLNGYFPFPWQERLAARVCATGWPKVIALPTGSGKTACLDIAIFALAHGADAPRRIFYIVDRRLIVDEAFQRMQFICDKLAKPTTTALREVRDKLVEIGCLGDRDEPVRAFQLRGAAYRDDSWIRSPLQPMLVASTVDQAGSCLLFRGYGVSDCLKPIYASLIGNDALLLLDEAHASRAFAETLAAVEDYRKLCVDGERSQPFAFVEMTATPSRGVEAEEAFKLDDDDQNHETLSKRLRAAKPVRLAEAKVKRDDWARLSEVLVAEALSLARGPDVRRIAIICNRVKTAQLTFARLQKEGRAVLLTGRMRPLDKDDLYRSELSPFKSGVQRSSDYPRVFVVSTQSLEVGADLDFDVMVTELASLDALLQRFGRLNRMGDYQGARGAIIATSAHLDIKKPDPIYGVAMAKTWQWLKDLAQDDEIQMGLENATADTIPMLASKLDPERREEISRLGPSAPLLMPAHLDALAQTNPRPFPEPHVAWFLHGTEPAGADVNVIWRADLAPDNTQHWEEIVAFNPPLASEALPVRLSAARRWLVEQAEFDGADADIEGVRDENDGRAETSAVSLRRAILWRNGQPTPLDTLGLFPGDTIVLPVTDATQPPESFGHIPASAARDLGDRARWLMKSRVTFRLHPNVIATSWPECAFREQMLAAAKTMDIEAAKAAIAGALELPQGWLKDFIDQFPNLRRNEWSEYPGKSAGLLFAARYASKPAAGSKPVRLQDHLNDVHGCARALTSGTLDHHLAGAVSDAALRHDWGKVDPRFQSLLRGDDGIAGMFAPVPLAKSSGTRTSRGRGSGLPRGFRHELLSFLLADAELAADHQERDLVLHLIASHHGFCRPIAPVIIDPAPCSVHWNGASVSAADIQERPAYHLGRGVSERFWSLTRRFGWWGLPYLESMLRLADWEASGKEASEVGDE